MSSTPTRRPSARTGHRLDLPSASRASSATALLAIGALHVAWGAGATWPMATRDELSGAVLGSPGLARGGEAACYSVAGLLGVSAAMVSGWPRRAERPRRIAVAGISAVLAARGLLGLAGRTDLVSPGSTGQRFRELDRRIYSPLCLALATLSAMSLRSPDSPHSGG